MELNMDIFLLEQARPVAVPIASKMEEHMDMEQQLYDLGCSPCASPNVSESDIFTYGACMDFGIIHPGPAPLVSQCSSWSLASSYATGSCATGSPLSIQGVDVVAPSATSTWAPAAQAPAAQAPQAFRLVQTSYVQAFAQTPAAASTVSSGSAWIAAAPVQAMHQQLLLPAQQEALQHTSSGTTQEQDMQCDSIHQASPKQTSSAVDQQPSKRGRPPKNPNQYSKAYMAIRRYREKRKGMLEQMEQEIANKTAELAALEAQNKQLKHKHQALEVNIAAQDAVLSQVGQIRLSLGMAAEDAAAASAAAATAAAAAFDKAVEAELSSQCSFTAHTSSTSSNTAAADLELDSWFSILARTEAQLQRTMQQLPLQREFDTCELLGRYKAYVAESAVGLAQVALNSTGAGMAGAFSPFPFSVAEALQLWHLSQAPMYGQGSALVADTMSGAADNACCMVDQQTGELSCIGEVILAVQQVPLHSQEQQHQLAAARDMFAAALGRLENERSQLLQQLHDAAANTDAAAAAAAVGVGVGSGAVGLLSLSGSQGQGMEQSLEVAAAVERYLVRARAVVLTNFVALKSTYLDGEQLARLCVASWPCSSMLETVQLCGCVRC